MRTAVIGLDSADHHYIDELIRQDLLPHLAAIRSRSKQIPIRTVGPVGRVWESFLLGYEVPEDMHVFDPERYKTHWLGARPEASFFAQAPGVRAISFDVPFMSLTAAPEGVHVTAWNGHNPGHIRASQPPHILSELDAAVHIGDSRSADLGAGWYDLDSISLLPEVLGFSMERRVDALLWLQERVQDWDFLICVFSETHDATESLWHGLDLAHPLARTDSAAVAKAACASVYEALDRALGRLISALPSDCAVVLCSLHGAAGNGEDLPATVLLPELLYRLRFGKPFLRNPDTDDWRSRGYSPVTPRSSDTWFGYMRRQIHHPLLDGLRRNARRRASRLLRGWIRPGRRSHSHPARFEHSTMGSVPAWYRRYWHRMEAFALPTFYDGRVRVNLEGRERRGNVPLHEYKRICDELESAVTQCTDVRTGKPVIDEIWRPDADDPRDLLNHEADLVISWKGYADSFHHPDVGTIGPFPFRRTGGHSRHGFAWVSNGSGVAGEDVEKPMLDIPPLIMSLLTDRSPGVRSSG